MTFEVKIDLGNSAMREPSDVADLLRKLAERLDDHYAWTDDCSWGTLRDINGDRVGAWAAEGEGE